MIPAPSEPFGKIEMYSPRFYAACTAGGILSCGLTHMSVTPLDLVKCNMQVYAFDFRCVFFSQFKFYISVCMIMCLWKFNGAVLVHVDLFR